MVSFEKTFYLLKWVGGLKVGEVACVELIIKMNVVFFVFIVYLCDMIEIKPITEYERTGDMDYPYIEDPLFEYVNKVANNFWWEPVHEFDEETGEEYFTENPSFVPSWFARRYLDGKIDLSKMPLYIEAVGEEVQKKHVPMDEIDSTPSEKKRISKDDVPNISMTLKAFGLDYSKFWYLCVCIKDWVESKTCEGARIDNPTHRQDLEAFVAELNRLDPKPWGGNIITKGKAKLTLNVKGRNTIIEDGQTLALIGYAVYNFLNSDVCKKTVLVDGKETRVQKNSTLLDSSKVSDKKLTKQMAKTVRLALFYKYLSWFMKHREIDEDLVNESPYLISTNRDLLISRMAYFTGLTDNAKYLEPDNAGKGYIRTAISGYEDVKVGTDNKYYGSGV